MSGKIFLRSRTSPLGGIRLPLLSPWLFFPEIVAHPLHGFSRCRATLNRDDNSQPVFPFALVDATKWRLPGSLDNGEHNIFCARPCHRVDPLKPKGIDKTWFRVQRTETGLLWPTVSHRNSRTIVWKVKQSTIGSDNFPFHDRNWINIICLSTFLC